MPVKALTTVTILLLSLYQLAAAGKSPVFEETNVRGEGAGLLTYSLDFRHSLDFSPGYMTSGRVKGFSVPLAWQEVRGWSANNGLSVDEDDPIGGLNNRLCSFISAGGARIRFENNAGFEVQRLVLDFVRFRPLTAKNNPLRLERLKILVNGQHIHTVEYGYNTLLQKPLELMLDPELFPDGQIEISLVPSGGTEPMWALWDAFLVGRFDQRGNR